MNILKLIAPSLSKTGAAAVAAAAIHAASRGHVSADTIVALSGAAVSLFGLGHKADRAEAFIAAVAADVAKLSQSAPVPAPEATQKP